MSADILGRESLVGRMQGSLGEQIQPAAEKSAKAGARSGLDVLFVPDSVAVIGATERPGTVGRTVLSNLIESRFRSKVYAINPSHSEVLGLKAYKSIGDIPKQVDLAVVVTPALTVAHVIGECIDAGVKAAVVISAGFREQGPEGVALEQQIQQHLRRGTMRLIGPNCLGIMNPAIGLNASFAKGTPKAGNVAFLSQSGALLTAILDWSQREEVGFSAIVSTGSMLDVGWGDLIDYFGDDPHTHSILVYMESVLVSFRRPGSIPQQTHYRDQGWPLRGRFSGRGIAHGCPHRKRRGSRCGISTLRRAASAQHCRPLLYGGNP